MNKTNGHFHPNRPTDLVQSELWVVLVICFELWQRNVEFINRNTKFCNYTIMDVGKGTVRPWYMSPYLIFIPCRPILLTSQKGLTTVEWTWHYLKANSVFGYTYHFGSCLCRQRSSSLHVTRKNREPEFWVLCKVCHIVKQSVIARINPTTQN